MDEDVSIVLPSYQPAANERWSKHVDILHPLRLHDEMEAEEAVLPPPCRVNVGVPPPCYLKGVILVLLAGSNKFPRLFVKS